MIKLFRDIRKKLLSENKFSKYFKYAIGEIVLVVVGILIALQINNWNQQRLKSNQEYKLLLELRTDLEITQNELKQDISNLDSVYGITENLIKYLDTINQANYDKDDYKRSFMAATFNFKLYPRTIAFENLKSLGIELVQNDSIRNLILDIFDRRLPRVNFWENRNLKSQDELLNAMTRNFELIKDTKTFNFDIYYLIPNSIEPKTIVEFKNRIGIYQSNRFLTIGLYNQLDLQIDKLIQKLDEEYELRE